MEQLQVEKESYPIKYKKQLDKTTEGFKKTLNLLNDYNSILDRQNVDNQEN